MHKKDLYQRKTNFICILTEIWIKYLKPLAFFLDIEIKKDQELEVSKVQEKVKESIIYLKLIDIPLTY